MTKTVAKIGTVFLCIMIFIAIFAPILAPYDLNVSTPYTFQKPSYLHLLGTNDIGQDILTELIFGARTSLTIGFLSASISIIIGSVLGILAGWYGGWVDRTIEKLTAFMLAIPYIPSIIILSAFTPSGILSTSFILGIMSWAGTTRVVRTQTMAIKKRAYIQTIRIMGATNKYIFLNHIVRELFPWLMYQYSVRVKSSILAESALSFLGLGDSSQKSWGSIIYYAQAKNSLLTGSWLWWIVPPGLCIIIVACSLVLLSYAFEEKLDQRLRDPK